MSTHVRSFLKIGLAQSFQEWIKLLSNHWSSEVQGVSFLHRNCARSKQVYSTRHTLMTFWPKNGLLTSVKRSPSKVIEVVTC